MLQGDLHVADRFFESDPVLEELSKVRGLDARLLRGRFDTIEVVQQMMHDVHGTMEAIDQRQIVFFPVLTSQNSAIHKHGPEVKIEVYYPRCQLRQISL